MSKMHEAVLDALDVAKDGSRELDAAIWLALFEPTCQRHEVTFQVEQYDNLMSRTAIECDLGTMWVDQMDPPLLQYTRSLEAAYVLAERIAPHGRIMVERDHGGDGWAMVQLTQGSLRSMAFGKSPAIALCSALVDALQTALPKQAPAPEAK